MKFYGTVQNGELTLSAVQKDFRQKYLSKLKDGTLVKETLTRQGPMKTHQQVKCQFGLVVEMIRQKLEEMGIDVCGIAPNKQMVYDILKKACGGVGDMGETLGLSEMTIEQASKFFENCRAWAATQLGLNIPEPNKDWRTNRHLSEI